MEVIAVKSVYNVDTISKGNTKAWVKLMEFMKERDEKPVQFDFKGIDVIQPWSTAEFQLFMQDDRVHMKLWSSADTANTINIMCTLRGVPGNRAVNEEVPVQKTMTKEEIQVAKMANDLQQYFDITGDIPVLNIYKRFDQIGVPVTVSYVEHALKKFADDTGAKKIKLEAKGIAIQASVIESVTGLVQKLNDVGVDLEINSNDSEVMNKLGMYQSLADKKVCSNQDKLLIIKSILHPGKVGMLVKYANSKATDEFGRSGKGRPISCRVAIYGGMKKNKEGDVCVSFTTFNGNTFYTRNHWRLEHDNDDLDKLDSTEEIIPIEKFGMYNDFLGSHYHLLTPIQIKTEDTMVMYDVSDNGKITHTKMTIPERIKAVLDDWDIKYDVESLHSCIQLTREKIDSIIGGNG